ncbi:MAG: division/cell wall cluster transcriptional repressor MraZ, partial [Burkholderiaceae bacterium]|nr:division/cell wall cluster transcriptional repressor MraZ [Burkholderiaceae bacterium]
MFQGASALNLDAKGRMTIPAKHRDALVVQCEGRITLTRHPEGCLLMFPRPVWETHREQIAAWPMAARNWQRIYLGNAVDVEFDAAGRILVAPELRNAVGLQRDVMLLGMGSHFEIWDAA